MTVGRYGRSRAAGADDGPVAAPRRPRNRAARQDT